MRSPSSTLRASVLLAAFALSGCDESSTGNTGDPLNEDEIAVVLFALLELGFIGPRGEIDPGDGGPFTGSVDLTLPCLEGVALVDLTYEGTYFPDTEEGNADIEGTVDFEACQLSETETPLIVDGDPAIDVTWEMTVEDGLETAVVSLDGGVEFTTGDDRSGRCDVDFTLDFEQTLDEESVTVELTGSLCGTDASEFESLLNGV